jgi:hypothetical protein
MLIKSSRPSPTTASARPFSLFPSTISHHNESLIYFYLSCSTPPTHAVLPNTRTLHITNIIVPSFVDVRDIATLSCSYNLGNQKLNSVKWYKNDKEFYRWERRVHLKFYSRGRSHCCVSVDSKYIAKICMHAL